MKPTKEDALMAIAPGAGFVWRGDEYSGLEWEEGNADSKPTESELNTEIARLQAEWDAQAYARDRKTEYDALNQFEMQYDDKEDGTTTWEDAIAAIKTKYPKG
jgi:hypothetical protein